MVRGCPEGGASRRDCLGVEPVGAGGAGGWFRVRPGACLARWCVGRRGAGVGGTSPTGVRACVVPSWCRNLPRRDSLQRKRLPFRVRTCREGGCRNLSHRSSLLRKRLPFRVRVVVVVCVSGVRRGGVVTKSCTRASVCIWRVPCPRRCGSSACGGRSVLASVDFVRVGLFCARRHGSSVF